MKIVVDTNVLISATFWAGDSNRVIEKIEHKELELIISPSLLEEFRNVLGYKEIQDKIRTKNLEMKRTIEKIASISTIVEPQLHFHEIKDDPDDDKVLDCAVEGKAEFILSQDKHLLKLKEFKGIRIIPPTEFIKII